MRKRNPESGFIELLFEPWALAVIGVVLVACLLSYPFLTSVDQGEIVIKDCGGDLTVWRSPQDEGIHWDGLCRTETYGAAAGRKFKEPLPGADVDVMIRGRAYALLPSDDAAMLALHRAYGSEDAFLDQAIMPAVMEDIRAAVADPAWHEPKGNIVERKLKGALEYGIRRISPTGAIWSSHETKRALTDDIRRRLDARAFPAGIQVQVELGFVTER